MSKYFECDNCGEKMEHQSTDIRFHFPSKLDMENNKDFCCDKCLVEWVNKMFNYSKLKDDKEGESK